jgi:hypothetical protein
MTSNPFMARVILYNSQCYIPGEVCTAAIFKGHHDVQHNDTSHNDNQGAGFIAFILNVALANVIMLSVAMIYVVAPFLGQGSSLLL